MPAFGPPCFVTPVFGFRQMNIIQSMDAEGFVKGFVRCDTNGSELVPPGLYLASPTLGLPGQFAFAFAKDDIVVGPLEGMKKILAERLVELWQEPFVAMDVCDFLGDYAGLEKARNLTANQWQTTNKDFAERWLAMKIEGFPEMHSDPIASPAAGEITTAFELNAPNWLKPGVRVRHAELGEGVILAQPAAGLVKVFFPAGERQVPVASVTTATSRTEVILTHARGDTARAGRAWLGWQAHVLPLLDNVSALTSARIDLLPHQVVLTHRVATASPRRFLIADEVGLGKTIEAALILRELASRGELKRALMVVPAGLVDNWHRELNGVFHLNFEVFGSAGDVTDRKSNAFEKHHLLIASIDTLKLASRMARLKAAPPWDLVVFDEAHHLTAYRQNGKLVKTQNFKLAEQLKEHTRDLLLLSATPHQGDHFRFWMLVQLLNPTLFNSPAEMVEHRHRLNAVVIRRTKADACRPDGSTLFARRQVQTESFPMAPAETQFYAALVAYLQDGFALAKRQGRRGQGLAFVMTIFQKIAASSFAAVQRTLRRRLIALTIQESLLHDTQLDIDRRNAALDEARAQIRELHGLGTGSLEDAQVDQWLADYRYRILKLQRDEEEALGAGADEYGSETGAAAAEDAAITSVAVALPEERRRIKELLATYPCRRETKVEKLLSALGVLWRQNPRERMVVFATYLGSVEMLGAEIEREFPGQGVTVLKGGDHSAKTAAENRFKAPDGPRVLICTAAGREGINLQHARVLFNFDLPWNPMDLEQRIGRIHRYGQLNTAQVYNLVLSDTIEGAIFLLLDTKLKEIGRALGKVDERGQIAEDLRAQILGQLSLHVNYAHLYTAALDDPALQRTRVELDAAMANAVAARQVVFELFQDLAGFHLDDYRAMAGAAEAMGALVRFVTEAARAAGHTFVSRGEALFGWRQEANAPDTRLTTERAVALQMENVQLLGLDHPIVAKYLQQYRDLQPEDIGLRVLAPAGQTGVLAVWAVEARGEKGQIKRLVLPLAVDAAGKRLLAWERDPDRLWFAPPAAGAGGDTGPQLALLRDHLEPLLQRELAHRGLAETSQGFEAQLIGWIEAVAGKEKSGDERTSK